MSSEKLLRNKTFLGAMAVLGLVVGGALAFVGLTPNAEAQEIKPAITAPATVTPKAQEKAAAESVAPADLKHVEDDGLKSEQKETATVTHDCNVVTNDSASTWDTISAKADEYGCKLKSLFFKNEAETPQS